MAGFVMEMPDGVELSRIAPESREPRRGVPAEALEVERGGQLSLAAPLQS
jgi:hypothetical protein